LDRNSESSQVSNNTDHRDVNDKYFLSLFNVLQSTFEGTYYSSQLLLEWKTATIKPNYFKKQSKIT